MDFFITEINKICMENKKVAMFIDMDGTIVNYPVYLKGTISNTTSGKFINEKPIKLIIDKLEEISKINNIDLYILTLSKNSIIVEEKKEWLKKNINYIPSNRWIILDKQKGEYNSNNRDYVKAWKMKEIKEKYNYDKVILLDDDHEILKTTLNELKENSKVYHISTAII